MDESKNQRWILGVNFYVGDVKGAIGRMSRGGLLVVPSAPSLKEIACNPSYREAVLHSDLAIADSALMVIVWNLLQHDSIRRLSGLEYLRALLREPDVRASGNTMWVMAAPTSARKNLDWLRSQGIEIPSECVHMAPMYGEVIEDEALVRKLSERKVKHVVITVGGGTQERLGLYLKRRLNYLPAIHCIGAAIAFLSGDQVHIPEWADRIYIGWLFRCVAAPSKFIPRYLSAHQLVPLLWRYRSRIPTEG